MQQQIQLNQPADRVINDAASFLAKRRARVSDRNDRGFRFGLPGGAGEEGGRVSVASGAGGTCTVTVEADGLGVMSIADGLVRELRKQAKEQGRGGVTPRQGAAGTMRGDFSGLRERLGMPAVERPPRQPRETPVAEQSNTAAAPAGGAAPGLDSAPPLASSRSGDTVADAPPHRQFVHGESGPAQAPVQPPEEQHAVLGRPPSAEETGGVPQASQVHAGEPSETAKAHSGAGSHASPPVLDPSVPGNSGDSGQGHSSAQ